MSLDGFIMDSVVQPVVDRLPDGWPCFRIGRVTNVAYRCLALYYFLCSHPLGTVQTVIACGVIGGTGGAMSRKLKEADIMTKARPGLMNPFRIEPGVTCAMWLAIFILISNVIFDATHPGNLDAFDFASAATVISLAMLRAQPRHPNARRKSWLPDLGLALPQGSAA